MARLFIGLPLPSRVALRLREETDRLRLSGAQVSWVKPELMHVTLRFLGEVADRDLLEIHALLAEEAAGTGALRLVALGLGSFPPKGAPRVVWCGVKGESEEEEESLIELHDRIEKRVRGLGFPRDKSRFVPHVTLGRVRSPRGLSSLVERMGPAVRRPFGNFLVPEVILFESRPHQGGTQYTPLQTVALA